MDRVRTFRGTQIAAETLDGTGVYCFKNHHYMRVSGLGHTGLARLFPDASREGVHAGFLKGIGHRRSLYLFFVDIQRITGVVRHGFPTPFFYDPLAPLKYPFIVKHLSASGRVLDTMDGRRHRQNAVERVGLLGQLSRVELLSHFQEQPPLRPRPLGLALRVMYIAAEGVIARHVGRHSPGVVLLLTQPDSVQRQIGLRAVFRGDHRVADETILVTALRVLLLVVFAARGLLAVVVLLLKEHLLLIPTGGIFAAQDAGVESLVPLYNCINLLHRRTAADRQDHLLVAARPSHAGRCSLGIRNDDYVRTRRVPFSGTKNRTVQPLQTDTVPRAVSF